MKSRVVLGGYGRVVMNEKTEDPPANTAPGRRIGPFRRWIIEHDESWIFLTLYIGLAVVLSIWISLFWLAVVVTVHGAFEYVRQRHNERHWPLVHARVAWELKLDIALVIFALALAVYMEVIFGLAGLGSAARAAQAGARFAVWERSIRGVLLTLDDAAQVMRAWLMQGRPAPANAAESVAAGEHRRGPWGWSDRISLGFGVLCLTLLFLAPLLTQHDTAGVMSILLQELHPFPAGEVASD